jgi:hypothetical protein
LAAIRHPAFWGTAISQANSPEKSCFYLRLAFNAHFAGFPSATFWTPSSQSSYGAIFVELGTIIAYIFGSGDLRGLGTNPNAA